MPTTRRPVLALCLSILLCTTAGSAPGPVGPEFSAEDRPVPEESWWSSCSDANGVRTTIVTECVGDDCIGPDNLLLERRDAAGNLLAVPLRVNEAAARRSLFRVSCHPNGWLIAQWRDAESSCYLHRLFDPDGNAVAPPLSTVVAGSDCYARVSIGIRSDGSFLGTWAAGQLTGGSRVLLRAFAADGETAADPVAVSEDEVGWNRQPKIAIDENDAALVAWSGDSLSVGPLPVLVRFVGDDALSFGDTIRLDSFAYGENSPPAVTNDAAGRYSVTWSNAILGGRVARRVALSAPASTSSAPTHAPAGPPAELPHFGAAQLVHSDEVRILSLDPQLRALSVTSKSTWLLRRSDGRLHQARDDGVAWSAPLMVGTQGLGVVAIGGLPRGAAVALANPGRSERLDALRSDDGGLTWSDPTRVAAIEADKVGCMGCRLVGAAVEGTDDGVWIAAWAVEDRVRDTKQALWREVQRVAIARSIDNGKTWSPVATFTATHGVGENGFDLHTDGAGVWVLAWIDEDLHVTRSQNDGRSWSQPLELATRLSCIDCAVARRHPRLEIDDDRSGAWAMIFAASRYATDIYGYDGDVFVVRSTDAGSTWSAPLPVASYAAADASRESDPTLATEGDGRWVAAWTSHRPLDGDDGADPDVVIAVSNDGGTTWSTPVAARPQIAGELLLDGSPLLAVDADGVWMSAWRSVPYDASDGSSMQRIYAAIADAECGNGELEAGEACDDANLTNGDGCDENCTRSGCGNGIVARREECDDGNSRDEDACLSSCRRATCGDGVVHEPVEECDDGNTDNKDGCPTSCRLGTCGDGSLDPLIEQCDDGNLDNNDACVDGCVPARCGDGFVYDRVEACDDGNEIDDDACPNTCDRFVCGDGHTSIGFEPCDPADSYYVEVCTADCRLIDLCGDADGDGTVSITDVQRILRRGVGLTGRCPREACDMDSSGAVRVGDAQLGVAQVVGLDVGARCSIGTGNIVFWMDYVGELGSLQVEIDYGGTGGDFVGSASSVACEPVLEGVEIPGPTNPDPEAPPPPDAAGWMVFNDVEADRTLIMAMISAYGFAGPIDLFRCAFELPQDRHDARFEIRTVDAADPDFNNVAPQPLLGYRLE